MVDILLEPRDLSDQWTSLDYMMIVVCLGIIGFCSIESWIKLKRLDYSVEKINVYIKKVRK